MFVPVFLVTLVSQGTPYDMQLAKIQSVCIPIRCIQRHFFHLGTSRLEGEQLSFNPHNQSVYLRSCLQGEIIVFTDQTTI